jgi:hypothetical protein
MGTQLISYFMVNSEKWGRSSFPTFHFVLFPAVDHQRHMLLKSLQGDN